MTNFENLQGFIITDCIDPNAKARQQGRFASLFGVTPTFVELGKENPDLEAAGHLVDLLDATTTPGSYPDARAVVLVNVAPRHDGVKHKGGNGTPFCYARVENATVVSTLEGRSLSLARKLGLLGVVHVLHIPDVVAALVADGKLSQTEAHRIANTQFRSYEFLPLAAYELVQGNSLPAEETKLEADSSIDNRGWYVDNFGNLKTTLLPDDVEFETGKALTLEGGKPVTCFERLADVPKRLFGLALVKGSSGYGDRRWLELVQQGRPVADSWGAWVGIDVLKI